MASLGLWLDPWRMALVLEWRVGSSLAPLMSSLELLSSWHSPAGWRGALTGVQAISSERKL